MYRDVYTDMHVCIHAFTYYVTYTYSGFILTAYVHTYSDFHNDCLFFGTKKNYIDTER